jgi:serine/threonine protein kinase
MRKISTHSNVIKLDTVLELIQESKCTIFLVMELANGGELFDRIKIDCGTREETANFFFQQLLEGVNHCHNQGVCHRDLKPENLLLQDSIDKGTILKIADFGFSARFAMAIDEISDNNGYLSDSRESIGDDIDTLSNSIPIDPTHEASTTSSPKHRVAFSTPPNTPTSSHQSNSPLRVLKSIVGSPFYVAPEVLQARGYDGPKADIWSLGVILYAMLAGNLPFEQELTVCKRFRLFCNWVREHTNLGVCFWDLTSNIEFPVWLFPAKFSIRAKGLIVSMLHPDPDQRITVIQAMKHTLLTNQDSNISTQATSSIINPTTSPILVDVTVMTTSSDDKLNNIIECDMYNNNNNSNSNNNNSNLIQVSVVPTALIIDSNQHNINLTTLSHNNNINNNNEIGMCIDAFDEIIMERDNDDDNDDNDDDEYSEGEEGNLFEMEEDVEINEQEKQQFQNQKQIQLEQQQLLQQQQQQQPHHTINTNSIYSTSPSRTSFGSGSPPHLPPPAPLILESFPHITDLITRYSLSYFNYNIYKIF